MSTQRESGFSTLEVIAAVTIIAVALIPIANLQTQLARQQARLNEASQTTNAVQNALAFVREVNPALTPRGQRELSDGKTLTWTSTSISPPRDSANPPGYEIQLFRVRAEVRDGATASTFEVDLVGWRRSGEP